MQLPVKTHYATLAMLVLAEQYAGEQLVTARTIASEQKIPGQFLGQILQQLRSAGLIGSTRGASGGFRLSRRPNEISMADVIDAVCPWTPSHGVDEDQETPLSAVVHGIWAEIDQQQRELLERVSLDELLLRVSKFPATMFYI